MMCGRKMTAEGLPLGRREPGVAQDILAGADFLSVLLNTSDMRDFSETTSTTDTTTVLEVEDYVVDYDTHSNVLRPSRSTSSSFAQTSTEEHFSVGDRNIPPSDSSENVKDDVVLAVRVSSSVGKTINKELHQSGHNIIDETTLSDIITLPPTTEMLDQHLVASEEHPNIIVAKASKSELSVEESEPITKDTAPDLEFSRSYPARVEALPSQSQSSYDPTAGFLNQDVGNKEDTKQPYHQTVIYHDDSSDIGRARSVSYSSIIQNIPQMSLETEKPVQHERHERNFNGARSPYVNNFDNAGNRKQNETKLFTTQSDNKSSFVTPDASVTESWEKSEQLKTTSITTERNWETQEKPYIPASPAPPQMPKIYGQPEQNYEVDEVVSVVTNGRAHGVQPSLPPKVDKKQDDNQKVGYVVEGRNYRKYRVEERTADGFIVGEYGVVSHNDGSLRGVRYTADGTINPRVISDALMKFLSL